MSDKLDKVAAAAFLNVSERSLDRYRRKGLLKPEPVTEKGDDGRTHTKNYYSRAELMTVKEKMAEAAETTAPASAALAPRAAAPELVELIRSALSPARPAPAVSVADKLTLKLAEAAELAGLSKAYLLASIRDGKLKAEKRGRGWNIKRADLEDWVKTL